MPPAIPVEERFWPKVDKSSGVCWVWTGSKNAQGYGQIKIAGKTVKAHRVSWELSRPDEPIGDSQVLHRCDNPPCVRPSHLFLGTAQDNFRDAVNKGRMPKTHYTIVTRQRFPKFYYPEYYDDGC